VASFAFVGSLEAGSKVFNVSYGKGAEC